MRLSELKGIGAKTEELFRKLGVESVEDLLEFYPRDFEVYAEPVSIAEIGYRTFASVRGSFLQPPYQRRSGKLKITTAVLKDAVGKSLRVTWFNAPYMMNNIEAGKEYILRGRINRKRGILTLDQPRVFEPDEYRQKMDLMQPVYPLTKGLSNNLIIKAVTQAIRTSAFEECVRREYVPADVRNRYHLLDKQDAVRYMHFPETREDFEAARKRAAFEEIFLFVLTMKRSGDHIKSDSTFHIAPDARTESFLSGLPFELTDAQKKVITEINADMSSGLVMNRLIQGDVGSGKTIVALSACMNAGFAGVQSAFMAPTEVLAAQHFETFTRLFKEHGIDLHVGLLTGSMTALEKKVVYDALEDGRLDIVVGTHALFQEKVRYRNLGLIITDEQHRFGIRQRQALSEKGELPHMIVMSATPIPRTLALIIYGDMDVSVIDTVPALRKPIKNAVIDDSYKENAYRLIEREVRKGRQAYIICPLVEFSEGVDAQNVEDYTEMLRDVMPEDITIGMLHGQMKNAKKNEIMESFASGRIQVLVSTTVVEVGVDVPNATVMMIEDANRFGLAALHQLRGRVGRGADQSYCMFVCNNGSKEAMQRLEILKESNNGFEIAAKDLELRGPGELLGIRQSGELSFNSFDLYKDADLASLAAEAAGDIIEGRIHLNDQEKELLDSRTVIDEGSIIL